MPLVLQLPLPYCTSAPILLQLSLQYCASVPLVLQLSGKRKVTVKEYKGTVFVHIREFYEKNGQELPGKGEHQLSLFFIWLLQLRCILLSVLCCFS